MFPGEEIIEDTDAALQAGREKELYAMIHRLKGNLANFGFDLAAEKAMEVLAALKEQDMSRTAERYTEFRSLYLQITERINETE